MRNQVFYPNKWCLTAAAAAASLCLRGPPSPSSSVLRPFLLLFPPPRSFARVPFRRRPFPPLGLGLACCRCLQHCGRGEQEEPWRVRRGRGWSPWFRSSASPPVPFVFRVSVLYPRLPPLPVAALARLAFLPGRKIRKSTERSDRGLWSRHGFRKSSHLQRKHVDPMQGCVALRRALGIAIVPRQRF